MASRETVPTSSQGDSSESIDSEVYSPWPFLGKWVNYKKMVGDSYIFQCLSCLPKITEVKVNKGTKANLKSHFNRIHPEKVKQIDEACKANAWNGSRSRNLSVQSDGGSTSKKQRQMSIAETREEKKDQLHRCMNQQRNLTVFVQTDIDMSEYAAKDLNRRRLRHSRGQHADNVGSSSQPPMMDDYAEGEDAPFTHFLSPFSHQREPDMYGHNMPEEIVSVPDLVERLPDGSLHGNLPNVKSENFAPPPPALLPKVSTEEQQALLTLNTLAAAAAAQQGAGGVRGFLGRHDDAGDTSSSYDQDLDVKNEPICHVSLGENSDEDPEASNSQSNSNDASSARFSLQPGLAGPYLLKKETHCTTILDQLLKDDTFTDVTLTAEGQNIRAHKMVLCLASSYFRQVLSKESNVKNVIVFRDIKFSELKNIINFIYTGEATVDATELESFMKTAEMLEISSLCEGQKHAVARGLAASQRKRQRPEEDAQNQPKKNKVTASPQPATSQSSPAKEDFVPLLLSSNMREDALSEEPAQESDSETELDKNNSPNTNETNVSNLLEELPLSNTSLSDPIKLEREETSETEPIPGRCPFCAIPAFSSPPDMFQHLLVHHTGQPTYPCENCLRVYLDNSHLQNHSQMCGTIPHLEHS